MLGSQRADAGELNLSTADFKILGYMEFPNPRSKKRCYFAKNHEIFKRRYRSASGILMEHNFVQDEIFNPIDRSGNELRMLRESRTLSFRGLKDVEAVAENINSLAHAHTILPTISMNDKLAKLIHY